MDFKIMVNCSRYNAKTGGTMLVQFPLFVASAFDQEEVISKFTEVFETLMPEESVAYVFALPVEDCL